MHGALYTAHAVVSWLAGTRKRRPFVEVAGNRRIGAFILGLALLLNPSAGRAASLHGALVAPVERARRTIPQLGVSIVEVSTGRVVYERKASTALIPASNTKLLTTAAALVALGPGYQFETPILVRGEVVDGVLQGDLAVVGGGDPNFSGRDYGGDSLAIFKQWARRLASSGIHHVRDDVLLVDGLFDRQMIHPSWPRDQLDRWYEAPVSALSFNDNCVLVRMRPGAVGHPARVDIFPEVGAMSLMNRSRTTHGGRSWLMLGRGGDAPVLELSGTISTRNGGWERWVTVEDPLRYFAAALKTGFEREGLTIEGEIRGVRHLAPGEWRQVMVQRSDLLSAIEVTNKRSQNFYAESILKVLGARACGEGSWRSGTGAVRDILTRLGVPDDYRQVDGSGMSRANRIAPRHLTTLLVLMTRHRYGGDFLRSLPFAGEEGLNWEDRLAEPPYAGNVFAKTGSLRGVSALSGYAKSRSGTLYAFSILMNGVRSQSQAHALQNAIVRTLINAG